MQLDDVDVFGADAGLEAGLEVEAADVGRDDGGVLVVAVAARTCSTNWRWVAKSCSLKSKARTSASPS